VSCDNRKPEYLGRLDEDVFESLKLAMYGQHRMNLTVGIVGCANQAEDTENKIQEFYSYGVSFTWLFLCPKAGSCSCTSHLLTVSVQSPYAPLACNVQQALDRTLKGPTPAVKMASVRTSASRRTVEEWKWMQVH
jgi:hypothetical protein